MNQGTFMFEVRTFAVSIFIRIWPFCQPTSVRCQQACTTGSRVTCEVGRFAWKARACMWCEVRISKTNFIVKYRFSLYSETKRIVMSFLSWFARKFFVEVLTKKQRTSMSFGTFCMTIFCMGSHQVWKNFKTRWSGWERTWPSLVSETSEWILSPTPDDAEKNSKFMPTQPWPFRNIRPIHVFVLPGFITRIFQIYKTSIDASSRGFFKFINFYRCFPMIEFCRHFIMLKTFRIRWKPDMISKFIKVRSM